MGAIRFFDGTRYELGAAVVMDDHVHILVRPFHGFELSGLVHSWKSFSAHKLVKNGRISPVWLDEYHDTIIREGLHYQQAVDYIRSNPMKRWPDVREYQWLYLRR